MFYGLTGTNTAGVMKKESNFVVHGQKYSEGEGSRRVMRAKEKLVIEKNH